ncbi:MAG: AAA family ATPase [Thermoplasmata archaeon]|nr:AAA family ATPase [Thermoplasmata archaeon]
MTGVVALTGTPGTGKSVTAVALGAHWRTVEVADLARRWGGARSSGLGLEVDLDRLRRALRPPAALEGVDIVVGHLAHLLPIRDVVLLRCHPAELERRLRCARRGTVSERRENVLAEATDVVLFECVSSRRRIWEVDTTGRSVETVAREVVRRVRARGPSSYGTVDWLADPAVTAHLLDRPR